MLGLMKTGRGPGRLELVEVDAPRPGPKEVLVQVSAAGICGSDVHIRHDTTFYTPPVILGHEYSGVVVEVGADVTRVSVGDRVVSPATAYCGQCYQCMTGHVNRCTAPDKRILGVSRANGAFAEYVVVPEYIVHLVPKGVDLEHAALAEPMACVVHALVEASTVRPGENVVVQGPGTMGLLALQVAKAMGAAKVIVTGVTSDAWRLEVARKTGADITIDVQAESDPVGTVLAETDGIGADVVVEASGAGAAREQALEFVRTAGRVVLVGVQGSDTRLRLDRMIEKELTMTGTWGTVPSSWVTTLRLLGSGRIHVGPLITHRLSLVEWERGFGLMESQQAIKVLFTEMGG